MDTAKAFVALGRPVHTDQTRHWITNSKETRVPLPQETGVRTGPSLLPGHEEHAGKTRARLPVVPSPREHAERAPARGRGSCPPRLYDYFAMEQVGLC